MTPQPSDETPWVRRMVGAFNVALAVHALPEAGGMLDQDWELVLAFTMLASHFGGIGSHMAPRP